MMDSIDRGMRIEGLLPGRLQVPRRARGIQQKLDADRFRNRQAPHVIMDHVSVFAIDVNEENAAGGRVVPAPSSEERRVGKGCGSTGSSWWSADDEKKKI